MAAGTLPFVVAILASDVVLFLCMLTGLWRHREARRFGVCRFLWDQVWFPPFLIKEFWLTRDRVWHGSLPLS
ncbi:hypothetical protein OF83DRAFT_851704 [Amylostereum chailletii]|nr:hypothetical protein OF83DRAFT_851704 [Amylostereum chailletii]